MERWSRDQVSDTISACPSKRDYLASGEPPSTFPPSNSPRAIWRFSNSSRSIDSSDPRTSWRSLGAAVSDLRRLQLLYQHGYLDRPRPQLDYFHAGGSSPLVYGLASRGAGRLRRDRDIPFEKMQWAGRKKTVGRVFLEHTLLIADFMVGLELSCRNRTKVRFIPEPEIPLPPRTSSSKRPFRWAVPVSGGQKLSAIPDQVFALEMLDDPSEPKRLLIFLEADRGTMPLVRTNSNFTSYARKLSAYEATWKNGIHRSRFGFERMRVLTVTTNAVRTSRIRETCKKLNRGQG